MGPSSSSGVIVTLRPLRRSAKVCARKLRLVAADFSVPYCAWLFACSAHATVSRIRGRSASVVAGRHLRPRRGAAPVGFPRLGTRRRLADHRPPAGGRHSAPGTGLPSRSTALDIVLARRLQDGDPGGHARRALAAFPRRDIADSVLARYFLPEGRPAGAGYAPVPKLSLTGGHRARELNVVGNFVEVFLAKEGHNGSVGVNYLEKVQLATPFAVLGAMLAGVDHVLIG